NQNMALQSLSASVDPTTIDAQELSGSILSNAIPLHPCVYYGVRAQAAATSVNLAKNSGRTLGVTFGDYNNRPLGVPVLGSFDGKQLLSGPFLELRSKPSPMSSEPVERVYLWKIDPKTSLGKLVDDKGGDRDRVQFYVDDWLMDSKGELVARSV